jgi:hypothetical protein
MPFFKKILFMVQISQKTALLSNRLRFALQVKAGTLAPIAHMPVSSPNLRGGFKNKFCLKFKQKRMTTNLWNYRPNE